jgi:hypothetical protein
VTDLNLVEMKQYQLTSNAFTGFVDLYFNELGLLVEFSLKSAELSEKQQVWILKNMPRELAEINRVIADSKTAKLTEIKLEITFEMFWQKYDDKQVSSKKKAAAKWNKMTKTDQLKAFNFINTYFNNISGGTRKKYAETYLNAELWNN